ncbi:MAG: hypothetical protein HY002_04110 [Candidatus Rokubacteria bacterium]|nr:hypothetical protein [Candidatus Rokubacteria bacterium]
MMLRCKCGVKNYLDPYPFWNFKGRTKCAGCDTVYAVEIVGGRAVGEPRRTTEESGPLLLPGFADTRDFQPLAGPGKTRPAPQARADVYGKPKPIVRNSRGRLVSGRPLRPDELIGSRSRYIVEGREPT